MNRHNTVNPSATLSFSDHRPTLTNLEAINDVLKTLGVHLSHVNVPEKILPVLKSSQTNKLDAHQTAQVLEAFALDREEILAQVRMAGRKPVVTDGGSLSTGEIGVAPYPKVYDLKAMSADDRVAARNKFGKLHVNATDDGVGVDEVMTIVSGGPFNWYFLLRDFVVVKLTMEKVDGQGFRISYPGLTPHGALMDPEHGVIVAHITGPKTWKMRYEANVDGNHLLGKNPWLDF